MLVTKKLNKNGSNYYTNGCNGSDIIHTNHYILGYYLNYPCLDFSMLLKLTLVNR